MRIMDGTSKRRDKQNRKFGDRGGNNQPYNTFDLDFENPEDQ